MRYENLPAAGTALDRPELRVVQIVQWHLDADKPVPDGLVQQLKNLALDLDLENQILKEMYGPKMRHCKGCGVVLPPHPPNKRSRPKEYCDVCR